jgi:hypothetical protein
MPRKKYQPVVEKSTGIPMKNPRQVLNDFSWNF